MNIPNELKKYLGNYGEQIFDAWCGEPIGWGYEIVKHCSDDIWEELKNYGDLECCYPTWFLITHKLTREEAENKYGGITDEEFGVRGGWKSITFRDKKFCSKYLR